MSHIVVPPHQWRFFLADRRSDALLPKEPLDPVRAEERRRAAKYVRERGAGRTDLTESIAQALERGDEW